MFKKGINGVDLFVCNTDAQSLKLSPVKNQIRIGKLGAGNDPEKGRKAAEENRDVIRAVFDENTRMVFITAGMGGGTGTGASPVIAKIAKKMQGVVQELKEKFTGGIRGEVIMTHQVHEKFFSDKANCRNAANGLMKRKDGEAQRPTLSSFNTA